MLDTEYCTEIKPPVLLYRTAIAVIAFFGRQPFPHTPEGFAHAIRLATALGAHPASTCVLKPASRTTDEGYKQVLPHSTTEHHNCRLHADGVVLRRRGSAVIMPSRDCASAWVENPGRQIGALGHCGREAMRPSLPANTFPPVPHTLLTKTGDRAAKGRAAWVFGSICPDCFPHESKSGQVCVKDFRDVYGEDAFEGDMNLGKLHIPRLTRAHLSGNVGTITLDVTCTRCDERLSSYRRIEDEESCNLTVAVLT